MGDFTLKIIGKRFARPPRQKASDLSIDVSLPGFHEGIEHAP